MGAAIARMFIVRIPSSAKPRRTSSVSRRRVEETGASCCMGAPLNCGRKGPQPPADDRRRCTPSGPFQSSVHLPPSLEDEKARLMRLVADLTLDKHMPAER